MKPNVRVWLLGILFLGVASCARQGHNVTATPGCPDPEMSEAQVQYLEQMDPEQFEAQFEEEAPVLEALTRNFFELRDEGALVGSAHKENMDSVTFHKVPDPGNADSWVAWLEQAGHDMSEEQACEGLYLAQAKLKPDCRRLDYFFCRRAPGFELLSTYREGGDAWVKVE